MHVQKTFLTPILLLKVPLSSPKSLPLRHKPAVAVLNLGSFQFFTVGFHFLGLLFAENLCPAHLHLINRLPDITAHIFIFKGNPLRCPVGVFSCLF